MGLPQKGFGQRKHAQAGATSHAGSALMLGMTYEGTLEFASMYDMSAERGRNNLGPTIGAAVGGLLQA